MKKILILFLLLATPCFSDFIDFPAKWNVATLYSVKYAEVNIGSGIGLLAINTPWFTLDEHFILYASQHRTALGLASGFPLANFQRTGLIAELLPGLEKIDAGIYAGWGYSPVTSDSGIAFNWTGFDFGLSCIKKF